MADPTAAARARELTEAAHRHLVDGDFPEAARRAREALGAEPDNLDAASVLGLAALELGQNAEAMNAFRTAASMLRKNTPGWVRMIANLSRAQAAVGRWQDAEIAVTAVEDSGIAGPVERHIIGSVMNRINLAERSLPNLRVAAEAAPDRADVQFDLAGALTFNGRVDEAEQAAEAAIALQPDFGQAHLLLSRLKRWTAETAHLERLERLAAREDLNPLDVARVRFSLFKELDDVGDVEAAWTALQAANATARAAMPAWNEASEAAWVDAMIGQFSADRVGGHAGEVVEGPPPIFIVGLPRSGTTLVERILAAHSQVKAMGELPTLGLICKVASQARTPALLDAATVMGLARNADWRGVAATYQNQTEYLSGDAAFATDKTPGNSAYVGAIRMAFPQARIVHVVRDPMDSLFGAYKQIFNGVHEWSYSLDDLAAHYAQHRRLMAHWTSVLGEGLITVDYDVLVSDPEPAIRRLLEACGLAFEPACLTPHETAEAVSTASTIQVRSPITRDTVGGWRRYAEGLEPLRARLEALDLLSV